MERTRILVVDDDPELRRTIRRMLEGHGNVVREAESGKDALEEFARFRPDVVLLDLVLPDTTGVDVCREIRRTYHEPIIVLSVIADDAMKVAALDAGADDYVTKPFSSEELLARVRVALRRGATERCQLPLIEVGGLSIDLERHRVTVDHEEVHLTPTEFSLLRCMATHPGALLTHARILEAVWGDAQDLGILRTFVNQLRSKLGDDGLRRRFILTEPGIGYRFVDTETA